jgi:putative glycosyl hydrolase/Big-like domain-containing protein/hemolysin type calcium-binding protein
MLSARAQSRGRAWVLVIVSTGLALWLFAASTASAAPSEFYGISQGSLDERDVQGMAADGVHSERFLLRWKSIEPTRGSFHWTQRNRFIGQLASQGIRPVPFVWGSPNWVGSGALAQPPVNRTADQAAWRTFLQKAVARYGPGGTYWTNTYRRQYGPSAKPMPIKSWQIWNEPNLKKFFTPGATVDQSARTYARLLQISHDAIETQDPKAQIVFAGMPGYGDSKAWVFLDHVYDVAGARSDFDATALHPYARSVDEFRRQVLQFRASMTNHNDAGTPLWLTELAWGSGPPDAFGHNVGLSRQQQLLFNSFKLILYRRSDWNIERVYWFLWRDPAPDSFYSHLCSICGTAGLLNHDGTPKPAYNTFRNFTSETTPPPVHIDSGPSQDSFTGDTTPTFGFSSNEDGSTFECHFTGRPFFPCSSPFTPRTSLSDGTQTFFVKAVDAVGNESEVRSRHFTVDTTAPAVTITSGPANGSTSADPNPSFSFDSNEPGATFSCELDSGGFAPCSSPYAASQLAHGGHSFRVKATDEVGNTGSAARIWKIGLVINSGPAPGSPTNDRTPSFAFSSPDTGGFSCQIDGVVVDADCSSPFTSPALSDGDHAFAVQHDTDTASRDFTVDTTRPVVTMSSGPADGSLTNDPTPTFGFSSTESGSTFQCRYEGHGFSACSGARSDTPASRLSEGPHSFFVRAVDAAGNDSDVMSRSFTVDTVAPTVTIRDADRSTTTRTVRRARATFTLHASEHVSLRCRIDSRPFKSCSSPYRTPRLRSGTHRLKVKATDQAGNVGTKRKRFRIERNRSGGVSSTLAIVRSHPRCHGVAATLIGSPHGDQLRGTKGRDVIVGFAGNDEIDGRGGPDLICGRRGDDHLIAGWGDDRVLGGLGSDHIRGGAGGDTIRGGFGPDFCAGGARSVHCEHRI